MPVPAGLSTPAVEGGALRRGRQGLTRHSPTTGTASGWTRPAFDARMALTSGSIGRSKDDRLVFPDD